MATVQSEGPSDEDPTWNDRPWNDPKNACPKCFLIHLNAWECEYKDE